MPETTTKMKYESAEQPKSEGVGLAHEAIKHEEIAELKRPIQNILEQLREKIDAGEYGLVIGEDASGRVPTHIFYNFLKRMYQKNALPPPTVRFFAGSSASELPRGFRAKKREAIGEKLADYLGALRKAKEEIPRVLVVTDTVVTGGSIEPIISALYKHGVNFDIATVGLGVPTKNQGKHLEQHLAGIQDRLHAKIFFGDFDTPEIYGKKKFSGVTKRPMDVFSKPNSVELKRFGEAHNWPQKIISAEMEEVQRVLMEAREDSKIVADELVEWYTSGAKAPGPKFPIKSE